MASGGGSTLAGFDVGAHGGERRDDARHGPACQGCIAAQGHVEVLTRENSRQQTHGGARIAQIQALRGRAQTAQAHPRDHEPAVAGPVDGYAHGAKSRRRRQRVLALEKSAYLGVTLGDGGEYDRSMGHGLIPGHGDGAAQAPTRINRKCRRGLHERDGVSRCRIPARSDPAALWHGRTAP